MHKLSEKWGASLEANIYDAGGSVASMSCESLERKMG